jgi:hypothetical protein
VKERERKEGRNEIKKIEHTMCDGTQKWRREEEYKIHVGDEGTKRRKEKRIIDFKREKTEKSEN